MADDDGNATSDEQLVAGHAAYLRTLGDTIADIVADYLELLPTAQAVTHMRDAAMQALAGEPRSYGWLELASMDAFIVVTRRANERADRLARAIKVNTAARAAAAIRRRTQ